MAIYKGTQEVNALHIGGHDIRFAFMNNHLVFGKLVEGVDFVRADWLVVPYTSNDANTLPIESNNFNYKYKFYSFGNIGGVWTTNNKYTYYPNVGQNGIWGLDERKVVYYGKSYKLNTEISINCNANGIIMDGELMPNYGSSPYFDHLLITCYTSTGKFALSAVTVDGVERYIPCRLLRPIPTTLDANGIARDAGECGMWDKVGNKFYGNVANGGSFTVENGATT